MEKNNLTFIESAKILERYLKGLDENVIGGKVDKNEVKKALSTMKSHQKMLAKEVREEKK